MSSREGTREDADARSRRRPPGELRLTIALYLAIVAAVTPLTSVIEPGAWLPGVLALTAALLGVGFLCRRLRVPSAVVTVIAVAVWLIVISVAFFARSSFLGIIPTPDVINEIPLLVQIAGNEILVGIAPIESTRALAFVIITALGAVVIALDHVVITARMPLLATVALVAIWLIPAFAVPSPVNVLSFAFLAAALLFLIRAETRTREGAATRSTAAGAGVATVAAGIGVTAITLTILTTPTLPTTAAGGGIGTMAAIDATLDLGENLRQPSDVEVLRVRSNAPAVPYLRVATLSQYDGRRWEPDRYRSVELNQSEPFGPLPTDEDVRVTEYRTTVEVGQLAGTRLPIAFPAVTVDGTEGFWRAVPFNRTVTTAQSNTHGQTYEVVSHVPRPTREQIRAADATMANTLSEVFELPEELPAIIPDLAQEVTAGATNDYDRLMALQSFFRGATFTYSLDAPVEAGFDGDSVQAAAEFLEVREGYCVHFASAFTLMARSLDIPARIVIGFLPGTTTNEVVDSQRVHSVTTNRLHAWPEVHFEGIGWVSFEPTKSLGTPTNFLPSSSGIVPDGGEDIAGVPPEEEQAAPEPTATTVPEEEAFDRSATGLGPAAIDLGPYLWTITGILVLAAVPGVIGRIRLERLRHLAAGGDIAAAWRIVQDTATDLGIPVPAAESPRAFGARLLTAHRGPAADLARLIDIVERTSYAPRSGPVAHGPDLRDTADAVRSGLLAAATPRSRAGAVLVPRSIIIRPGSGTLPAAATD